jgi:hypothetical protein
MTALAAEALDESPAAKNDLAELVGAHPPGDTADLMRQAKGELADGKSREAAQSGRRAAESLSALAEGLRSVQDAYQRPDLERLTAAERQAAEALEAMTDARSEGERALAQSKLDQAQETTEPLGRRDSEIGEALRALDAAERNASAIAGGRPEGDVPRHEGFAEADRVVVTALRELTQTLQRRIQEAILQGALSDPDEAVPPEYRQMVEEYYRALSEDLR